MYWLLALFADVNILHTDHFFLYLYMCVCNICTWLNPVATTLDFFLCNFSVATSTTVFFVLASLTVFLISLLSISRKREKIWYEIINFFSSSRVCHFSFIFFSHNLRPKLVIIQSAQTTTSLELNICIFSVFPFCYTQITVHVSLILLIDDISR